VRPSSGAIFLPWSFAPPFPERGGTAAAIAALAAEAAPPRKTAHRPGHRLSLTLQQPPHARSLPLPRGTAGGAAGRRCAVTCCTKKGTTRPASRILEHAALQREMW
jgi:hypothetical protein